MVSDESHCLQCPAALAGATLLLGGKKASSGSCSGTGEWPLECWYACWLEVEGNMAGCRMA
jgi:hypothetical protein